MARHITRIQELGNALIIELLEFLNDPEALHDGGDHFDDLSVLFDTIELLIGPLTEGSHIEDQLKALDWMENYVYEDGEPRRPVIYGFPDDLGEKIMEQVMKMTDPKWNYWKENDDENPEHRSE